ncbi:MAG: glycosyltransferase family 2 protein [bacterium]
MSQKAAPRATVIIPNHNGEKLLPTCLDSLAGQSCRNFAILVVDNGSTDGSLRLLNDRYPHVEVLRFDENRGFAAAVNAGIARTGSELIALLNNDTEVHPEWLGGLVAALDRRPDVAFCASKMIDFTDRSVIDSVGNCYARNGRSIPRGFLERDAGRYGKEEEVFGACAGAALYRRSLFEEIGLFDERLVSYKEDVDLDFRAQLRSLRCLYVPSAICYHVGGATTGRRKSDPAVRFSTRNSVTVFVKNMPAKLLPGALPRLLFDLLFQLAYQVLRGRQAGPFIRGLFGAVVHLPHAVRERRRIQASARFDLAYLKRLLHEGDVEVRRYRRRCRIETD